MIKAVLMILLFASISFAYPVSTGLVTSSLKYSTHTTLGSNHSQAYSGVLGPVAKTINTRKPFISQPSSFNPNRNVIHSNATLQTWDYLGYCIDKPKTVQLKSSKIACSYQKQDRQWNTWSCATPGYLRCVGTSCPKNTCRVPGVQVT